jgi:hypothetical protein
VALFALVPAAFLSMRLWQPYSAVGGPEAFLATAAFMSVVFIASALGWRRHPLVAALGFIACFLWLACTLLPVLGSS